MSDQQAWGEEDLADLGNLCDWLLEEPAQGERRAARGLGSLWRARRAWPALSQHMQSMLVLQSAPAAAAVSAAPACTAGSRIALLLLGCSLQDRSPCPRSSLRPRRGP